MADNTKIEWTDATWQPITGCQIVSDGCKNCYAMQLAGTRLAHTPSRSGLTRKNAAGKHIWTGETRFNRETLDQPLRWKRPRRIFVCAHGDLFAESVPTDWIDQVFAIMALAPQHTFQVLTKRPERMREYVADQNTPRRVARVCIDLFLDHKVKATNDWPVQSVGDIDDPEGVTINWPLPNVWLGVSVEDQAAADARIPHLLATPAAIRWISAEPLLGLVDLSELPGQDLDGVDTHDALAGLYWAKCEGTNVFLDAPRLDWVVVGGESGPGARPMHPGWARSLRDQCAAAGVPYFFKQWGKWVPAPDDPTHWMATDGRARPVGNGVWSSDIGIKRIGKARAGRTLDGITHDAWPEVGA
jgi:protein gp37